MFGYIVINEPELRIREYDLYRSYYCGLCEDLHLAHGRAAQLALNYDTTFLALLLTSLYEPEEEYCEEKGCIAHPLKKHRSRRNAYTAYAADMTVLLSYYSCRDDWEDEKSLKGLALAGLLSGAFSRVQARYPEKAQAARECLERLHALEARGGQAPGSHGFPDADAPPPEEAGGGNPPGSHGSPNAGTPTPDEAGGCFGDLLAALFSYQDDAWSEPLRRMGFYLGKFIYLLDAYDDLEKDRASGSFNALLPVQARYRQEGGDFDGYVRTLLTMLMSSCCRAFEALPIVENADILRNILYAGVWTKFEQICASRTKNDSQKD